MSLFNRRIFFSAVDDLDEVEFLLVNCNEVDTIPIEGLDHEISYDYYSVGLLKKIRRTVKTMRDRLIDYCVVLPVLGFNSSKYDLNVIKKPLLLKLMLSRPEAEQ